MNTTQMLFVFFSAIFGGGLCAIVANIITRKSSAKQSSGTVNNVADSKSSLMKEETCLLVSRYKRIGNIFLFFTLIFFVCAISLTVVFLTSQKAFVFALAMGFAMLALCLAFAWRYILVNKNCSVEYNCNGLVICSPKTQGQKLFFTWTEIKQIVITKKQMDILCHNGCVYTLQGITVDARFHDTTSINNIVVENK